MFSSGISILTYQQKVFVNLTNWLQLFTNMRISFFKTPFYDEKTFAYYNYHILIFKKNSEVNFFSSGYD